MAENSKIEWTDHTFNPWIGCQKVSPGCDHCYAEAMCNRYGWTEWGPHGERKRTSEANWKKPLAWNRAAQKAGERHRVFCASLADWLDNQAPQEWRRSLHALILATPDLDWLLLTKRIENYEKLAPWKDSVIPGNVWLGVTAEDQANYDRRWPILRDIPARVRFISHEPALGLIYDIGHGHEVKPDWLIMGGESGPGARTMDPQWASATRDVCAGLGIKFFFKQMTAKKPIPADLLVRQFPCAA